MMRVCADNDDMPKRITPQPQPGAATLGCLLVVGLLLPTAVILWAIAARVTIGAW